MLIQNQVLIQSYKEKHKVTKTHSWTGDQSMHWSNSLLKAREVSSLALGGVQYCSENKDV